MLRSHIGFLLIIVLALLVLTVPLWDLWLSNQAALKLEQIWIAEPHWLINSSQQKPSLSTTACQFFNGKLFGVSNNVRDLLHFGWVLWLYDSPGEAPKCGRSFEAKSDLMTTVELVKTGEYDHLASDVRAALADWAYAKGVSTAQTDEYTEYWLDLSFNLSSQVESAQALVDIYRKRGDEARVSGIWKKMVESNPDDVAEHWWALAELETIEGDWKAAARAYSQGANLAIDPYKYWLLAGYAWEQAGNWSAAAVSYENAHQARPNAMMPYLNLGHVYRAQEQYREALIWYAKAENLSRQSYAPYYFQGLTYYLMGDYVQAKYYLSSALERKPDLSLGMYYLAQAAYHEESVEDAELWLSQAIEYQQNSSASFWWWLQLGDLRIELDDCSGASEAYSNAYDVGHADKEKLIRERSDMLSVICGPQYNLPFVGQDH